MAIFNSYVSHPSTDATDAAASAKSASCGRSVISGVTTVPMTRQMACDRGAELTALCGLAPSGTSAPVATRGKRFETPHFSFFLAKDYRKI